LSLPEQNVQNQNSIVAAVKLWLKVHKGWLLVLDNIDDLRLVEEFLPPGHQGSVLLTTRLRFTGPIAQSSELETMTKQEGVEFLLHRANIAPLGQTSEYDRIKAEEIWEAMAGLPLALDQVGAYILETSCGISNYLDLYQKQCRELLTRRGMYTSGHPDSVTTTFSLSFECIESISKAAADLLRLCAFLSPDAIPEELITAGAEHLGPFLGPVVTDIFKFNETISVLLIYSLVRRNNNVLSIHRLAQAVIRDNMNEEIGKQWAERAVQVINLSYPDQEAAPWLNRQKYLPHAIACTGSNNRWSSSPSEIAQLLYKAATYLRNTGQFMEAGVYFSRALTIREQILGVDHHETAQSLNGLAILYREQGKYKEAEPLYLRALAIREQELGSEHIKTAMSLNNVAIIYRDQGKYEEAESLFLRSLAIEDHIPEIPDPYTRKANTLNQLAILYRLQGRYREAEPLFLRALAIRERAVGANHQYTAQSLNDLAMLYCEEGRYEEAEPLYLRALNIREQVLKGDHRHVAQSLNGLATLYHLQGKHEEAEPLYLRSLGIYERVLGINHPHTVDTLYNLISFYFKQGRYSEAEQLYQRALDTYKLQVELGDSAAIKIWEKLSHLMKRTHNE
jgi:tetratricopeptide (TPR) repeat protein